MKIVTRNAQSFEKAGGYVPEANLWRVNWKKSGYPFCGIYIVSPDNRWPSKIGISQNPGKRLIGLQVSCWRRLDIAEYRYVENFVSARAIESKCHEILTADGLLMNGEWFDIRSEKAVEVVDFAASTLGLEARKDIPDDKVRELLTEFTYYHKNSQNRKMAETLDADT